MNYREMRYVIPPELLKAKIITPGEIYSASVLEDIPNIIGDIWEIIDFRPPKDEEIYLWKMAGGIGTRIDRYSEGDFGTLLSSSPRFILQRKITNEDRLAWLLKRYNLERDFYRQTSRPIVVEDIDNEIRKERKK